MNAKIVIPSLAALVLTASVAVAQMPPPPAGGPPGTQMRGPMRANRTPPTGELRSPRGRPGCALTARRAAMPN